MSDKTLARRTNAEIYFDGVNISESIRKYLLSLTYTDNEADEADDLQIMLEDREGIWLTQWLNAAIQAAASSASIAISVADGYYKVIAQSGLNVRKGPGTSYAKIGTLAYGTPVAVKNTAKGWAEITYSGKTAYVSANYLTPGGSSPGSSSTATVTGLRIQAVFIRENWNNDGKDKILDCGQFELDSVDASGPPANITIKGTALPFSSQIRQTKKSRAWEAYTLSGIANEMAKNSGMACLFESTANPYYSRVEQFDMSDIAFLSILCQDAGISLKASNNILVLFDQATYEAKPAVITIKRGSGSYLKYKLSTGEADKAYTSCRVSYVNPANGAVIEAVAYVADYDSKSKNNQRLEVSAKVTNISEAKRLAEKRLRLQNKYEKTATFTLPGNPDLISGETVMLSGWGAWSGKYLIKQAKHVSGSSGYTTQIRLRHVLEGY